MCMYIKNIVSELEKCNKFCYLKYPIKAIFIFTSGKQNLPLQDILILVKCYFAGSKVIQKNFTWIKWTLDYTCMVGVVKLQLT